MKSFRSLLASCAVAGAALIGAVGSAQADEWFVLSQQTIKAADLSTSIKSEGGRWAKDIVRGQ